MDIPVLVDELGGDVDDEDDEADVGELKDEPLAPI
jgi:hypothetical protein